MLQKGVCTTAPTTPAPTTVTDGIQDYDDLAESPGRGDLRFQAKRRMPKNSGQDLTTSCGHSDPRDGKFQFGNSAGAYQDGTIGGDIGKQENPDGIQEYGDMAESPGKDDPRFLAEGHSCPRTRRRVTMAA